MASIEQRKRALRRRKNTNSLREFAQMRKWFPNRPTVVSEGDSWFTYPSDWVIDGKPANLIDHISRATAGHANFLAMASNGDEAVGMMSGKAKHKLIDVLRSHEDQTRIGPVDFLLFSGGGNDIVGENDFERFLEKDCHGRTEPVDCIELGRARRKARQIGLAFEELLDIRDHFTPGTIVMTHTYDYAYPSDTGAVLLGGLIKKQSWAKRFMDDVGVDPTLQADVIRVFMDLMAEQLLAIEQRRSGFVVVDTRGTLTGRAAWLNEIHPTADGFKALAAPMVEALRGLDARF